MELTNTCRIKLDKGTQKVKCYKFYQTDFNRELALHADIDKKNTQTNITDIKTGLRLCSIPKEVTKVNAIDIDLSINEFIKHYTYDVIMDEFKKLDGLEEK